MAHAQLHRWMWRSVWVGAPAAAVLAVLGLNGQGISGDATGDSVAFPLTDPEPTAAVTYAKDIAPILQQRCQICHQPNSIGPMSLMTYEEVKRYAPLIKHKVVTREMPPYHYDTDVGIQQLKNDWRLSQAEINAIVAWVDGGQEAGDPADMPAAVQWPTAGEYRLASTMGRQPDVIVRSTPYTVPAYGADRWWQPSVPSGVTDTRCIMAIETKPSVAGRAVVHHGNTTFSGGGGGGRLSEYALGKIGEVIPADACRVAPANSNVSFDIHYYPNGTEVRDDVVEVGIWFYPEDVTPQTKYRQSLTLYYLQSGTGDFEIPPNGTLMTQGFHTFTGPIRIDSWQPHGHLRLVASRLEILQANGQRQLISMVSNWHPGWHHSHVYQDNVAPLMPDDAIMVLTQWYDNTVNNPHNPDADQWVGTGDRTADEMSHAWIAITQLDQAGFDRLRAERTPAAPAGGRGGRGGAAPAPAPAVDSDVD